MLPGISTLCFVGQPSQAMLNDRFPDLRHRVRPTKLYAHHGDGLVQVSHLFPRITGQLYHIVLIFQ